MPTAERIPKAAGLEREGGWSKDSILGTGLSPTQSPADGTYPAPKTSNSPGTYPAPKTSNSP